MSGLRGWITKGTLAVCAAVAGVALLLSNVTNIGGFVSGLWFPRIEMTVTNNMEEGTKIVLAGVDLKTGKKILEYRYEIKNWIIIRKRSLWSIKNCKEQLTAMGLTNILESEPQTIPIGIYDREFVFKLSGHSLSEIHDLYYRLVCDDLITDWKP